MGDTVFKCLDSFDLPSLNKQTNKKPFLTKGNLRKFTFYLPIFCHYTQLG